MSLGSTYTLRLLFSSRLIQRETKGAGEKTKDVVAVRQQRVGTGDKKKEGRKLKERMHLSYVFTRLVVRDARRDG